MPLTVTADDGRRTGRFLLLPPSPVTSLLLVGVVLVVVLLPLQTVLPRFASHWPFALVLGPACLVLTGLAVRTVPGSTRPADRAEKALRGLAAAVAPITASVFLADAATAPALAVVVAPALVLAPGVVVARRSGAQQAARSETGGATEVAGRGLPAQPLPLLCRWLKRSVDVVVAGTVLVLGLPVLAFAAVSIMVEGRGGVLFTQTRVGRGGRHFRMYKLRTMRPATDERQHRAYVAELIRGDGRPQDGMYKLVADDRRTRVGRVLRSFSIDELPQLWNVLRGDMSVVGPRPPLPAEVALYDDAAWARMAVNPGLTGLWQVSGRSRLSFQEMVELDVRYWQEWSPLLDLRILLRTPKAVLWGRETA